MPHSPDPPIRIAVSPAPAFADNRITVSSIAVLAYIIANVAHEGAGHALGFYLAGGKSAMLTTTRLIEWIALPDPQWRIFDLGGPAGNLACGFLAWLIQRFVRQRPLQLQFFLWLAMAFSLFWAFGYMIFSGITGTGDWLALIHGSNLLWIGRATLVLLGFFLYRSSIRLVARELRFVIHPGDAETSSRILRLIWISYISAGLIACAGAMLDPRGAMEVLRSGVMSSFAAFIGLFYVPRNFSKLLNPSILPKVAEKPISWDLPWILAASAGAIYFIGILGPGILIYMGN
jgi:hypothetical protein